MKKIIWYFLCLCMMIAAGMLIMVSPDKLSAAFTVIMTIIVVLATVFGMLPLIRYMDAFRTGRANIRWATELKPEAPWLAVLEINDFFYHRGLDEIFTSYKDRVQHQRKSAIAISNIDEVINEDLIAMKSWQGVIHQIPGTLTGLGLLGTFVGLIIGIQNLQFNTMDSTIASIQQMLSGIGTAFYTSIAGVILSVIFNIFSKMLWEVSANELKFFSEEFQRNVIPPEEEQTKFLQKQEVQKILERLDRIPQNAEFSLAHPGATGTPNVSESAMLAQIREGLKNDEFFFHLQPKFDLNTRRITGAEALVRWNHPEMGLVLPSAFIPAIENNGFITKLDCYIWEKVCQQLRHWIDYGMPVVPVTVNISKTDILALDVGDFMAKLVQKYRIPPRYLEIDIAQSAYLQAQSAAVDTEAVLRQSGFRVAVDGFNGDFMALNSVRGLQADTIKLDMRFLEGKSSAALTGILSQSAQLNMNLVAEGIENMEQMSVLRKGGCTEGQGYYLSKPMPVESFEKEINKG